MTPAQRRRRLGPEPPGMPPEFWDAQARTSRDRMRGFDRLPAYMQDHVREKNTTVGAKVPQQSFHNIMDFFRPGVATLLTLWGMSPKWDVCIDETRDIVVLSVMDKPYVLFTRQEILDDIHKIEFSDRVRAVVRKALES